MNKEICIEIEGSVVLNAESVWPMGDGPKDFTAKDVVSLIKSERSLGGFLEAWSMGDQFDVLVIVDGQSERVRPGAWD